MPLFSHSPQCRMTRREEDNKGVGRKRTSGITNASDKAHHVQDTEVKGHGSFAIIVSRSSAPSFNSPPLSVSFSRMPSVARPPPQFRPCTTRGNDKRNGTKTREKETNDERELFS